MLTSLLPRIQPASSSPSSYDAFRRAGDGYRRIVQTTAADVSRELAASAAAS